MEEFFIKAVRQSDTTSMESDWRKMEKMLDDQQALRAARVKKILTRTAATIAALSILLLGTYQLVTDSQYISKTPSSDKTGTAGTATEPDRTKNQDESPVQKKNATDNLSAENLSVRDNSVRDNTANAPEDESAKAQGTSATSANIRDKKENSPVGNNHSATPSKTLANKIADKDNAEANQRTQALGDKTVKKQDNNKLSDAKSASGSNTIIPSPRANNVVASGSTDHEVENESASATAKTTSHLSNQQTPTRNQKSVNADSNMLSTESARPEGNLSQGSVDSSGKRISDKTVSPGTSTVNTGIHTDISVNETDASSTASALSQSASSFVKPVPSNTKSENDSLVNSSGNQKSASKTSSKDSLKLTEQKVLPVDSAQKEAEIIVKEDKPQSRFGRWSVALTAAPDFSVTSFDKVTSPGSAYGLMIGYRMFNRLVISSGVIKTFKRYGGYGSDYQPPTGYWKARTNGIVPDEVKGQCSVIEIPLTFQFDVLQRSRSRLFASAGISSYRMLNESYKYTFYETNEGAADSWSSQEPSNYTFGIGHLSIGYERMITRNVSLGLEPYMKVPFKGIGWSNVNLYTTGVYVNLRYTFQKKNF